MHSSPTRPFLLRHWGLLLGLLLIAAGLLGVYSQLRAKALPGKVQSGTGLLCKIYPLASPPTEANANSPAESKKSSAAPTPQATEPTLLTGATLKLNAPPKASVNETVVVSLCVEPKPGLP